MDSLRRRLTLKTSASESLYGGQFTLSTQLIKPNYLVIFPPTQHLTLTPLIPSRLAPMSINPPARSRLVPMYAQRTRLRLLIGALTFRDQSTLWLKSNMVSYPSAKLCFSKFSVHIFVTLFMVSYNTDLVV